MNAEDVRILLVEDEIDLAEMVRDYLLAEKYQVTLLHNGAEVIDHIKRHSPHIVLLDLMLPGKDGLTLCREIRTFSDVAIIMITARVDEIDRLLGLELGADDYICKPSRPREIVARVKAVLRRTFFRDTVIGHPQPLVLDESRYIASMNGQLLDLTVVEFRLLKLLSETEGRVYSRNQIIEKIYSDDRTVSERSIDTHIKNLRKKIGDASGGEPMIQSVYGVGYKWESS